MQQNEFKKPLLGSDNNALVALLAINLLMYVMLGFLKVIYFLDGTPIEFFYKNIFNLFTLPTIGDEWLKQVWSLFTYNWVHDGFWVLLTNMIWLSLFGYVLQMTQANKHIFPIYFYAGLISGLAYIMVSFYLGKPQGESSALIQVPLMGASMSVTALAFAATLWAPRFKLLVNIGNGIPLWVYTLIYIFIQIAGLNKGQSAYIIFTIICATIGIVYVLLLKKGMDLGKWMHHSLHWLNKIASPKTNG